MRWVAWRLGANCVLHPLIHTFLKLTLAQDVGVSQRFSGLDNELSQTGYTLSSDLTIRSALHLGHLTAWSLTRLISIFSKNKEWLIQGSRLFPLNWQATQTGHTLFLVSCNFYLYLFCYQFPYCYWLRGCGRPPLCIHGYA